MQSPSNAMVVTVSFRLWPLVTSVQMSLGNVRPVPRSKALRRGPALSARARLARPARASRAYPAGPTKRFRSPACAAARLLACSLDTFGYPPQCGPPSALGMQHGPGRWNCASARRTRCQGRPRRGNVPVDAGSTAPTMKRAVAATVKTATAHHRLAIRTSVGSAGRPCELPPPRQQTAQLAPAPSPTLPFTRAMAVRQPGPARPGAPGSRVSTRSAARARVRTTCLAVPLSTCTNTRAL